MTLGRVLAALAEITANLDAYAERRAREIAAPRIAEAEADAEARVNEVMAQAEADKQRSGDLVKELQRCLAAQDRQLERLRGATRG